MGAALPVPGFRSMDPHFGHGCILGIGSVRNRPRPANIESHLRRSESDSDFVDCCDRVTFVLQDVLLFSITRSSIRPVYSHAHGAYARWRYTPCCDRVGGHGKYIRRVLIVGAGDVGERLRVAFEQYPWMGVETVGFVDDFRTDFPGWLGTTDQVAHLLDEAERSPETN